MRSIAGRLCLLVTALIGLSVITVDAEARMCVKYARSLTGFNIRGDAWTWWQGAAESHYQRAASPAHGAVLVFKKTGHLSYGHVATVSDVLNRRTIRVDHSWSDGYTLERGMLVVDTSSGNDWSSVRVWNEGSDSLGLRTYPTYGFILPNGVRPSREAEVVDASWHSDSSLRLVPRSTSNFSGVARQAAAVSGPRSIIPTRKPATVVAAGDSVAAQAARAVVEQPFQPALLPARKPVLETPTARPAEEQLDAMVIPARKPGGAAEPAATQVADAGTTAPALVVAVAIVPSHKPRLTPAPQVAELADQRKD
ncbi:CHAP domain-containing protein [uncultured Gammaproteobacteria bacterium]